MCECNDSARRYVGYLASRAGLRLPPDEMSRLIEVYAEHQETMRVLSTVLRDNPDPAYSFRPTNGGDSHGQ